MNYRITITRTEPDPEFPRLMEEYERNNRGRYMPYEKDETRPYPERTVKALVTELTEEQFKNLQTEIFRNFE